MSNFDNLLGLAYDPGYQDCYSLVRKYYAQEWGLELPNFARPHNFWEDPNLDLYQLYKTVGFKPVFDEPLQLGDGLLMPLFTKFATHGGVLAADNKILHHLPNRLSSLDDLRPGWFNKVTIVVRHPEVSRQLEKKKPAPVHLHEVADVHLFRDPELQDALGRAMGSRS